MIAKCWKQENNARQKKFAVDLFVELQSHDKAIFVILFELSVVASIDAFEVVVVVLRL